MRMNSRSSTCMAFAPSIAPLPSSTPDQWIRGRRPVVNTGGGRTSAHAELRPCHRPVAGAIPARDLDPVDPRLQVLADAEEVELVLRLAEAVLGAGDGTTVE